MHLSQKAIGILGGTFDPVHIGHLRLALEAYEALALAKVHLIPCYQPVHRQSPAASHDERLAMIACAVENEPALYADAREIRRKTPSYMIDTLQELRDEMPATPLCLLIGLDAFLDFPTWHRFEEILKIAHVIVAHRPFFQLPSAVTARSRNSSDFIFYKYRVVEYNYKHHRAINTLDSFPLQSVFESQTQRY